MNLPNKITISRICLIPVFVATYYMTFIPFNYVISAFIFALAAYTDFLDGYLARKYNLVTNMGKFLDPIADKVLVATALILMVESGVMPKVFGAIFVAIILSRELIVTGFRLVAANCDIVIAADKIGKIKTVFQDLATLVLLLSINFFGLGSFASHVVREIGFGLLAIATILTIWSGISYIYKNRKVLTEND